MNTTTALFSELVSVPLLGDKELKTMLALTKGRNFTITEQPTNDLQQILSRVPSILKLIRALLLLVLLVVVGVSAHKEATSYVRFVKNRAANTQPNTSKQASIISLRWLNPTQ